MSNKAQSCDTFVVLPPLTRKNLIIFGKNSDRPQNEVQEVVYFPRKIYSNGSKLKCTYIEIDQIEATNAVIISKPEWMWGAEMGANEHNVVIGNEALFTKLMDDVGEQRLLGMDLVRLALERSRSAREAVTVITDLLRQHGQGGPCSENDSEQLYYMNSYLIVDTTEAWILETIQREWIAQRVTTGYRNISNCLTIETEFDLISDHLKQMAIDAGLWNGADEFNFSKIFATDAGQAKGCQRFIGGKNLLENLSKGNEFDINSMMKILRDTDSGICRSVTNPYPTQGSQISVISGDTKRPSCHWFTGTPDPGRSVFKPFIFGENVKINGKIISPRNIHRLELKLDDNFHRLKLTNNDKDDKDDDDNDDRKHLLYRLQEQCYNKLTVTKQNVDSMIETLRQVESNCIDEVEETLENYSNRDNLLIDELFYDSIEAELRFYK